MGCTTPAAVMGVELMIFFAVVVVIGAPLMVIVVWSQLPWSYSP